MLEAGRYYVGDLSVVLTPQEVKHIEQFKNGYCSLPDGSTIWKTTLQNGLYRTSLGNTLSVSVGVFGVVPMKPEYSNNVYVININKYGMIYTCFDKKVSVKNDRGDISINELTIDTNQDGMFGGELTEIVNNKEFMDSLKEVERVNQQ
jgi:hypothetical protein